MPIYKENGKKDGFQKYSVRVNYKSSDGVYKQLKRIAYGSDAAKELEDLSSGANLERRFAELERSDASADLLLEDLKKKMQALPDKT